jgi:hypothetical protein
MNHISAKLINKNQWNSLNLKYTVHKNYYDKINISKIIIDDPKVLDTFYENKNNILHILIYSYNSNSNKNFNYLLSLSHRYNKLITLLNHKNNHNQTPLEMAFDLIKLRNAYFILLYVKNFPTIFNTLYISPLFFKIKVFKLILLLEKNNVDRSIIKDCKRNLSYCDKLWNSYLYINF